MIRSILKGRQVVLVAGDRKEEATRFMYFIFKDDFSVYLAKGRPGIRDLPGILRSDMILIEDNPEEDVNMVRDLSHSLPSCFFVVTRAEKGKRVKELLQGSSRKSKLIMDLSMLKKVGKKRFEKILTFGVNKKKADFYISDAHKREGETNFKVNYESNIIPFWVKEELMVKDLYAVLPALCLAELLDLNLAKVSYNIREELSLFTKK